MSRRTVHIFSKRLGIIKELSERCPNVNLQEVMVPKSRGFDEKIWSQLNGAEILISDPIICPYVHKLPNLKWLQLTFVGVETIVACFKDLPPPAYLITRFGGIGPAMSEYVLGIIIAMERKFKSFWEWQKEHFWLDDIRHYKYRTLSQLTLGILGYGDIGQCVARDCKALRMTIWAMGRSQRNQLPEHVDEYRTNSGLSEILQSCDYICNILPSTPDTKNLLSGNVLQVCKARQACFINVGRGDVIDEKSLVNALKEGWISGAVLDVTETEPLPIESELWDMSGVTITSHLAALPFSNEVAEVFAKNLKLYEEGKQLDFVVDVKRGY